MECPVCARPLKRVRDHKTGKAYPYCQYCGWGYQRLVEAKRKRDASQAQPTLDGPTLIKLLVSWLLGTAFVLGPYIAIRYLFPERGNWVDPVYWLGMACYVFIAATVSPNVDRSNLGVGGTAIDNPFTFDDDWNRKLLMLAIALLPGKMVWFALRLTWALLTVEHHPEETSDESTSA